MALVRLTISNLRNISVLEMAPGPGVNLIIGPNGSGKTSVLEGVYLLGSQRSFRANNIRTLIKKGCDRCTVYGQTQNQKDMPAVSVGVMRDVTGGQLIKIAGERSKSAASLAQLLPLQVINPGAFKLIEGGPKTRRQFIDWGVFHVEQSFFPCWRRLNRCLKQRNTELRHARIDPSVISAWDRELVEYGSQITRYRNDYIAQLEPLFQQVLQQITKLSGISLVFYPGWDSKISLGEVLQGSLSRDQSLGYTRYGPHRADLRIRSTGQNADQALSRGEQKMVITALKIAQGNFLYAATGRKCIYLVDDLAAELDEAHKDGIFRLLSGLGNQVFVTAVDENALDYAGLKEMVALFHVEQGQLTMNSRI